METFYHSQKSSRRSMEDIGSESGRYLATIVLGPIIYFGIKEELEKPSKGYMYRCWVVASSFKNVLDRLLKRENRKP